MWGFTNLKDILEIVLVPGVLAFLAYFLPKRQAEKQAEDRRERFEDLIMRELQELKPCEEKDIKAKRSGNWTDYQNKEFLHEKIFDNPSENRDFILSLDPTLVYHVSQLWKAKKADDSKQWLYYLGELSKEYGEYISDPHEKWKELIDGQHVSSTKQNSDNS